ncbi:hypothetical protein F5Y16DRAFT_398353 [Xylariaceae sp. FL0255]|nr:hypothetical protein F5Y16DRAFT_398353 [Xylariaceae sp. FL0255]
MTSRDRARRIGAEVADFFERRPENRILGFAGIGRHGGALIVQQRNEQGQETRKVVVKYSLGEDAGDPDSNADEDLRNEYYWLQKLRGAEHIVQLVDMEDGVYLPGTSDGEATYDESVQLQLQRNRDQVCVIGPNTAASVTGSPASVSSLSSSSGSSSSSDLPRRCPTFALEYLPGGTIGRLMERCWAAQVRYVPNRLLWRIWLCAVRQVIAMLLPPFPDGNHNGDTVREEIVRGREVLRLCQNSPHYLNWMFGDPAVLPGNEHIQGVPIVKLIDFGRGALEETGSRAARLNIRGAARVLTPLMCISCSDQDVFAPNTNSAVLNYTDDTGTRRRYRTSAPAAFLTNENIDIDLRIMIARIRAHDPDAYPTLREVLEETEAAIRNKGALYQNWARMQGRNESDQDIRLFIQRFILDPPWS